MRKFLLLGSLIFLLSSCLWNNQGSQNTRSPYPSTPLGVSSEITIEEKDAVGKSFSGGGAEPYWMIDIVAPMVALTRSNTGGEISTETFTTTQEAQGKSLLIKGIKGDFFLTLSETPCTNGISTTPFTHSAILLVGADTLTGCVNEKK